MSKPTEIQRDRWVVDATGGAALIALTALALWLVLGPILDQRDAIAVRLDQLDQQHALVNQKQRELADYREFAERLRLAHDQQAVQLQPAEGINRHVARLTHLVNGRGLEVHQVQPGKPAVNDRYRVVPIVIAGRGEYPDCAELLNELQDAFPDTGVRQWELLNTLNDRTVAPSYRLELAWYTQP